MRILSILVMGFCLGACASDVKHVENHETSGQSESERMACTMDVKQCPNGSFVSRDSRNQCQFKVCPQ